MVIIPHWLIILFVFALGSCIGSFLNVVVWRLPRNKSLFWPPSACPKCDHRLASYDNIPVFGWIMLGGKCRYCKAPISPRYPIIEAITGLLFVFYYVAIFIYGAGPFTVAYDSFGFAEYTTFSSIQQDGAVYVYGLLMLMVSALLAASLIDAELYIIPIEIPWVLTGIALLVNALIASPSQIGSLSVGPAIGALSAGAVIGLLISYALLATKVLPRSFPDGEPLLDFERKQLEEQLKEQNAKPEDWAQLPPVATKAQIRKQIAIETLFLVMPVVLGIGAMLAVMRHSGLNAWWSGQLRDHYWLGGLLGSAFGAMVGGATIWFTRIFATFALGRVAMGQGDTHLMIGIGAVLGAGPAIAVFFLAPFCGLIVGIYKWLSKGARELPYGPYLSLAACVVIVMYRSIDAYFRPHVEVLGSLIANWLY